MTGDRMSRADFDKVIASIPSTWTCCRCHKVYPNRPDREPPMGFEVSGEYGKREITGQICASCWDKQVEP